MMVEIDIYQERKQKKTVQGKTENLKKSELIKREFSTRKFLGGCFWIGENKDEEFSENVYFECEKSFTVLDWLLME